MGSSADLVAFASISDDDYWNGQAEELRDNLRPLGIDLVVAHNRSPQAKVARDLNIHYSERDNNFIDFCSTERRRILYLDAEVRLLRPLPAAWMDDVSVVFYHHGREMFSNNRRCFINTGQGIWNKDGQGWYKLAADRAAAEISSMGYYEEEAFLHEYLGDHIKARLCMDRRSDDGCEATRGFWKTKDTVINHPYLQNISYYFRDENKLGIPAITEEFFVAHFSPHDINTADMIWQRMITGDARTWKSDGLPIDEVVTLGKDYPGNLTKRSSLDPLICYSSLGWKFCPALKLLSPIDQWNSTAWTIDDKM